MSPIKITGNHPAAELFPDNGQRMPPPQIRRVVRVAVLTFMLLSLVACANLAEDQRLARLCRPSAHPIAVLDNAVVPTAGEENPGGDDAACVASCQRGDNLSCVAHLRTACSHGDPAACIDYKAKVGIL